MTEEFLHHIWKFRLFDQFELKTTQGELVEILKPGEHNFDAGPDFFNGKIKVGDTLWAGNIEVHIHASDWNKHNHQQDKAYDNIVLHVVHTADKTLSRQSGAEIPTVELKDRIHRKLYQNYLDFKSSIDWIACEKQIASVPTFVVNSTIDRLLLERLERKSQSILNGLALNHNNWEETFYQHLARNFGFKTNAEPFELLAKSIPSVVLGKHKSSLLQIEALLFGQAGMLFEHFEEKYPQHLQNEYAFLKQKFKLQPIEKHLWKYLRLRPINFPSIRIAQFANLIHQSSHLFSKIVELENASELKNLMNVSVSDYWENHFVLDKPSNQKSKHLGEESINNIIINTIVPFLFVYGKQKDDEKYIARALSFLEQTPGENNTIIQKWETLGVSTKTAHTTQALLQLKTEYCNPKKCLNCSIGNYLLKNS
ncbi:MAG: DUF2851 family protein [Bacteroidetes bacterium]|nr:DUF2851 family protein [Bacteroidota bacterium]